MNIVEIMPKLNKEFGPSGVIIGSGNGLLSVRRQEISWSIDELISIWWNLPISNVWDKY